MASATWTKIGKEGKARLRRSVVFNPSDPPFPVPLLGMPAKVPRVRLSKMRPHHVRMIEVLRVVLNATERIVDMSLGQNVFELARRGVLDPVDHFRWEGGRPSPSKEAVGIVRKAMDELMIIALIGTLEKHRCWMTRDGYETLMDWDDTRSDGVFPVKVERGRSI